MVWKEVSSGPPFCVKIYYQSNMGSVGVYVPVDAVFPEVGSDFGLFRELLEGLSLTDTLFWCSRLNLVISNPANPDHLANQQYALDIFFQPAERDRINQFAKAHGGAKRVTVFFRGQLLELIRWASLYCVDQEEDGITFNREEVRRLFAKAALIAGDIWSRRVYRDQLSMEGGIEMARLRALAPIRQAISANTSWIDPLLVLGRGKKMICEHLTHAFSSAATEFQKSTGLSIDDYFVCLCMMIANYLNRTPETAAAGNAGLFNVNTFCKTCPDSKPLFDRYIELESQTPEELREALWGQRTVQGEEDAGPYDYRPIRQRPILRATDGRAVIMDPVFYAQKASVGPLFHLLGQKASNGRAKFIFGVFGKAFESYASSMLEHMYGCSGSGLHQRLILNPKGQSKDGSEVEVADACLNDIVDVVFFEMKASWIPEDAVLHNKRYLKMLRQRYGVIEDAGSTTETTKGVGQIARAIRKLANGEWVTSGLDVGKIERVYPVLLVHDPLLDAPLHSGFLASEFDSSLAPDGTNGSGWLQKGRFRVARLIILTIEDLEHLETSVQEFSFVQLLRDYSTASPDRSLSLRDYIASSDYGKKLKRSQTIVTQTLEVLEDTSRRIFPWGESREGDQ